MTSRILINPLPKKSGVSLRATIQNPRPRKYASDADRQKAFRERQAVIQVRVKPETVETFDRIATTLGYSRQEVVYALLMSGLNNNRNWQQTGIPAFRLPRYEENPTMRKATPAQLAARERFAAMARSGAFKRKAKKNPAKKRSVYTAPGLERGDKTVYKRYTIINPMSGDWLYIVRDGVNIGSARSVQEAKSIIDMLTEGLPNPRKRNPAEAKERKPRVVLITNPKGRDNMKYAYALVLDDGGFTYGMDSRTPVTFEFSQRDRKRGVYTSYELPSAAVNNPGFQAMVKSLPGQQYIGTLTELRSLVKKFM